MINNLLQVIHVLFYAFVAFIATTGKLIPDKPFLQNLLSSGILQLPAFLYLRFRIFRFPSDN